MAKIFLKENELQKIISESVKKVLNEVSSDVAFRAYNKACSANRDNQANVFFNYGQERLKKELGNCQNIREMNNKRIMFSSVKGVPICVDAGGSIYVDGWYDMNDYDNWKKDFKLSLKTNKETARIVVKWINKFIVGSGADINPELLDWHFWAYL